MKTQKFIFLLFCFVLSACNQDNSNVSPKFDIQEANINNENKNKKASVNVPVFQKLPPERTGINFINRAKETNDLNIFSFEYFYNGAGISVGDINNDGLPDLYFSCNQCPNKLYLNRGNLQFENITKTSGIEARGKFKTGTAMVDINNDGYLDIFALRTGKDELMDRRNYVFINNKNLTFSNQSSTLGLDPPTNSIHVNFLDFDKDGDLDVFYGNHPLDFPTNNQLRVIKENGKTIINNLPSTQEESFKLFRNDNGKFVNIAEKAGVAKRGFALSSIVSDFNEDGYPDIFVGNDYIDPDYLFINQKNGTFKDERKEYFRVMSQNTMGTDYEDVNNDGRFDLFAADMLADTRQRRHELGNNMFRDYYDRSVSLGYGAQIFKNALQINLGNGKYSDQSYMRGVHASDWTWASLLADFNNDGSKDLFLSNGFRRDISDLDFMDFRDANLGKAMDVNNISELMDLIPSKTVSNKFFINNGEGFFEDATKEAALDHKGFSHGAVYVDLDNDGDLEIIVSNLDEPASIYKNMSRENDPNNSNYLAVRLKGPNGNLFGINAKVTLTVDGQKTVQEYRPMKGYMSCVENKLHFGLGALKTVTQLEIEWPDGKVEIIKNPPINQELSVYHNNAKKSAKKESLPSSMYKKTSIPGLVFKHKAKKYNDFHREPLLMHKYSNSGPAFTVGDINGDGLPDYYIGGAAGQKGMLSYQVNQGGFAKQNIDETLDARTEDSDACFFDADGDGDQDLYIVAGGSEFDIGSDLYLDRLLLNDGTGKFKQDPNLPKFKDNGSCVTAGDFDGDGDLDLFVGSKVVPGRFPEIPNSRLLINNKGVFTELKDDLVSNPGLVSDAEWTDLDNDGKEELIVLGEWMPIKIFGFDGSKFIDLTGKYGLNDYTGLWQKILLRDLNGDGNKDIVAGNYGLNTRYKASIDKPLTCYGGDLDNNDFLDPILCMFSEGKNYPLQRKATLSQTLPMVKKKFVKNVDYAKASVTELFDPKLLSEVPKYQVTTLESCVFIFKNGKFVKQQLPYEAQAFPIRAIEFDSKSNQLFLAGSIAGMEVINGPNSNGFGLVLQAESDSWKPLSLLESGFFLPYSTNEIKLITNLKNENLIVSANHNGPLIGFMAN